MPSTTSPEFELGLRRDLSNGEYHGGPGISSSQLKDAAISPRHYWSRHVDPDRDPPTQTDAMEFGSLVHMCLLEPDTVREAYCVLPLGVSFTDISKHPQVTKAVLEARAAGQEICTAARYGQAVAMARAAIEHPWVVEMLTGGEAEISGYWEDPQTGLLLKYRPDYRHDNYIVDYKTTMDASPDAFLRTVLKFGYHQSAAHYLDGDHEIRGTSHDRFLLIAQEKDPPYAVEAYYLDKDFITYGRRLNRLAKRRIAHCIANDHWPAATEDGPMELKLPAWAKRKIT